LVELNFYFELAFPVKKLFQNCNQKCKVQAPKLSAIGHPGHLRDASAPLRNGFKGPSPKKYHYWGKQDLLHINAMQLLETINWTVSQKAMIIEEHGKAHKHGPQGPSLSGA
jgi:hypothetical protein